MLQHIQDYIQHEVGLWFRSRTFGQNSDLKSVTYSIINQHLGDRDGNQGEWGKKYRVSSGPEKHAVFIFNQEISHHC